MIPLPEDHPRIAVVVCTYNGARFLRQQLDSLVAQQMPPALILISDDGSTDDSPAIARTFASEQPAGLVQIVEGPRQGSSANFFATIARVPDDIDFVALSDQDDVWHCDRLSCAVTALSGHSGPALYGAATRICDENLTILGLSRITRVPLTFRHAMTQNFAGGNTMLLNREALRLVQTVTARGIEGPVHDWMIYQLVSGAGGQVIFDPDPCLDYRQHSANLIGDAGGLAAMGNRLRRMVRGDYRVWLDANLATLDRARDLLTDENARAVDRVTAARRRGMLARLALLWNPGLYRQGILGQMGLVAALLLGRF